MNVWILNHYAGSPDMQATRSYDLGKGLVKRGHQVTIFASSFSHYKLQEERLLDGETKKIETYDGVRFVWVKTVAYEGNTWRRAANMLSFARGTRRIGRALQDMPDVIIGTCVHPFAPLSAYFLSRKKKSRFFYEITDLWPQTLVDMGELSNRNPITIGLRILEKFLLKRAEQIVSLLPRIDEYLDEIGIDPKKMGWIPNGVDVSLFEKIKPYAGGENKPFTFLYLGGHSQYHRLELILDAAKILEDKGCKGIRFVLVGGGTEKNKLIAHAENLKLKNVEFRDVVPKTEVARVIEEADVLLYSFRKLKLLKYGVSPVKIFDYLASGRPIIYSVEGRNNPVSEAGAGITIPPEDPRAWAKSFEEILGMSVQERIQMGLRGQAFVKENHAMDLLVDRLEKMLVSPPQN